MDAEQAKKIIIEYAFTYNGSCHCGGFMTWKYKIQTEDGDVHIKLRKANFLLDIPGKKKQRYPISEIQNILDEIFETHKIIVPQEAKIQSVSK